LPHIVVRLRWKTPVRRLDFECEMLWPRVD
jgi:hypothetical protein